MITLAARPAERGRAIRQEDIAQRLRQRIVGALHLGRLTPNERLPSTRAVAAELGVDPRRVARAYRDLVMDGLVDLRPRSGFYVAASPSRHPAGLSPFGQWAVDALVGAGDLGVPPIRLADELRARLTSRRLTAACVECNDDQIHGLAAELQLDYGFETHPVPLDRLEDPAVRAVLGNVDLLVTTAYHATEVRRLARKVGKPSIAITIGAELRQWLQNTLKDDDVYFVVADQGFSAKAAAMFADVGGSHQIRVLVAGRDDLSAIPAAAATYVTRRARELLGSRAVSSRALCLPRLFSRESRRAIVTFIVEANLPQPLDVAGANNVHP